MVKKIIFISLGALFFHSVSSASGNIFVRVAVIQDEPAINLKINGPYEILDSPLGDVIHSGSDLKTTVISLRRKVRIDNLHLNRGDIFIRPKDKDAIKINGRRFRDNVQIINRDNKLLVINFVDLEDYVKGVLYHEASHYWPMEALKAQAITSRTFALYQIQQNYKRDYDVTSDIYSQVYGGRTSERYRTNRAVNQTKGSVLTYRGEIFPTYYHATCAGHTEDASLLWDINIAPLKGVACNFCKDSPHFNWNVSLSKNDIRAALKKQGYSIRSIDDMVILDKDKSGRVSRLKIISGKDEITLLAKTFRNIIGPNIIRSTNFKPKVYPDEVYFEGLGWGHGVGMCQWGAYFMAKGGLNYKQILNYYYPGSKVLLIDKLPKISWFSPDAVKNLR